MARRDGSGQQGHRGRSIPGHSAGSIGRQRWRVEDEPSTFVARRDSAPGPGTVPGGCDKRTPRDSTSEAPARADDRPARRGERPRCPEPDRIVVAGNRDVGPPGVLRDDGPLIEDVLDVGVDGDPVGGTAELEDLLDTQVEVALGVEPAATARLEERLPAGRGRAGARGGGDTPEGGG